MKRLIQRQTKREAERHRPRSRQGQRMRETERDRATDRGRVGQGKVGRDRGNKRQGVDDERDRERRSDAF